MNVDRRVSLRFGRSGIWSFDELGLGVSVRLGLNQQEAWWSLRAVIQLYWHGQYLHLTRIWPLSSLSISFQSFLLDCERVFRDDAGGVSGGAKANIAPGDDFATGVRDIDFGRPLRTWAILSVSLAIRFGIRLLIKLDSGVEKSLELKRMSLFSVDLTKRERISVVLKLLLLLSFAGLLSRIKSSMPVSFSDLATFTKWLSWSNGMLTTPLYTNSMTLLKSADESSFMKTMGEDLSGSVADWVNSSC